MILESALWLPSIWPGMWPPRMKEERKRMKALGGRGMYDASRFFACDPRPPAAAPVSVSVSGAKVGAGAGAQGAVGDQPKEGEGEGSRSASGSGSEAGSKRTGAG